MRVLRWGAFVSWLIVAGIAVGGFAAFSPKPAPESSSTTVVARVADGRGLNTGRIVASAFATAAVDRSFLTAPTATHSTVSVTIEPETTDNTTMTSPEPPSESGSGLIVWPSGSTCLASWYGPGFEGKSTANGESFDPQAFTAALHDVPFGTIVKVTSVETGAVTTVRVNDRGPYEWDGAWKRHPTRCIDLSEAAMAALGAIEEGVIAVTISY